MVYLGTCSSHLLKACRRGPLQWPGLRCAGPAGLILKLARLAHQDYWIYSGRNSGGYTAADTAVDIQHSRHSG